MLLGPLVHVSSCSRVVPLRSPWLCTPFASPSIRHLWYLVGHARPTYFLSTPLWQMDQRDFQDTDGKFIVALSQDSICVCIHGGQWSTKRFQSFLCLSLKEYWMHYNCTIFCTSLHCISPTPNGPYPYLHRELPHHFTMAWPSTPLCNHDHLCSLAS